MNQLIFDCTAGGLLHDIGKIVFRTQNARITHSRLGAKLLEEIFPDEDELINCAMYHHSKELRNAQIPENSAAYIVYLADNIASAADRRDIAEELLEEGNDNALFKHDLPLSSLCNIMNGANNHRTHRLAEMTERIPFPASTDEADNTAHTHIYNNILNVLKSDLLQSLENSAEYINSLLVLLEKYTSFMPSSTSTKELCDVSLYDHVKITAAAAACMASYAQANGITNFKKTFFSEDKKFRTQRSFLLFACDFSGIQKFIHTVESKGALKALRSRSFVLEIFMEHIIDEILAACDMSRANLLYSGGGHAYILLPNTNSVKNILHNAERNINNWLIENFGDALYLACAYQECSADALCNIPDAIQETPYKMIFINLAHKLRCSKNARYDAEQLKLLNKQECKHTRECRICGKPTRNDGLCEWCGTFADISNAIREENIFLVVSPTPCSETFFELPAVRSNTPLYASAADYDEAENAAKSAVRVYGKNQTYTGLNYATNIYMGDYARDSVIDNLFDERDTEGIKRIGVARIDADDMGNAFMSGFERPSKCDRRERTLYQTISRSAAFSRQMSLFFKYFINTVMKREEDGITCCELDGKTKSVGRDVIIVYSGGDDVMLVGEWADIIGSVCDIQNAFEKFTQGTLTLSAGIGIFGTHYPIYSASAQTKALLDVSKNTDGKASITLFDSINHTYKWSDLRDRVLPKVRMLEEYFASAENSGKAFLYKLLDYLRNTDEKINIARCAYLLARIAPATPNSTYENFSSEIMRCISDKNALKELVTAIYIYVYLTRKRSAR